MVQYPPGTSKWSRVEHRLFSFISINWRSRPLTDIRTIVELIAATTTKTGLTVECTYDPAWHPTGVKITKQQLDAVPLQAHDWHGEWNYTITPKRSNQPAPAPNRSCSPLRCTAAPQRCPDQPCSKHDSATGLEAAK